MSTNYVNKEYLIKNFQNFADKLKTIYQKQENVEFHVVDSYSNLASNPKVSMVSYVINDETVGTDIKKKGFYYYDIKEATPKWTYIEISGGSGTTNYNALLNKPSINGVELRGNKTLADLGITNYDDTQIKKDIADLDTNKQDKTDNALDTTDKTVVGAINEINDSLLDNVTFSADYKNIIINRKNGLNTYTIPIASIINNTKITELNDVDNSNIGDGRALVYDGATQKHKYVDSIVTDEFVKMDSTTNARYLSDLIDKSTVVNDNGVLKVKKLDGQEVTIAEINYLKGLTMNVMDLVNAFANGGVKVLNTPVNTHADLSTLDRSTFLDGISYIVYVLADETHSGAKTTYLCNKTSSTFFGNADSQRNFVTDPINLANEVTGKLGTANIDVDALWKLLTINDTYKTLTTKNEVFGTHGAKALYDELVTSIGKKANTTDLTTHTSDTDIHVTTSDKTKWNKVDNKADKTDLTTHTSNTDVHITTAERDKWNEADDKIKALKTIQNLEYKGESVICNNTLASRTSDMLIKGKTYVNLGTGGLESVGEKENKISISSNNNKLADDVNYKEYKKEILLPIKGGLKSLPNEVGDTIEQRNDGVYLVQRVGKYTFTGNEDLKSSNSSPNNYLQFYDVPNIKKFNSSLMCDTLIVRKDVADDKISATTTNDGIMSCGNANEIRIRIKGLETDVNGSKNWFKQNRTTVYYELKSPVETKLDIQNLDLEVYKGTTYITTDNAIQPTLSFKVPSNIGGVIHGNSQNINNLYKLIDEGVNKTDIDITTTIDSSSTDTQVPSAKAVKTELDKKAGTDKISHVSKYVCADSPIINDTMYRLYIGNDNVRFQKFINFATSSKSIEWDYGLFNKDYGLFAQSIGEGKDLNDIHMNCFFTANSKCLNTPDISKNFFGISLCHTGVNGYSTQICVHANENSNTTKKRTIYVRDSYNGIWGNWRTISTTSVADVPVTKIKLNNGFTGTVNYEVKNGVCYVTFDAFKSEKTGEDLIVSGIKMPKPSTGIVTSEIYFDRAEEKTGMVYILSNTDNRLKMHCYRANKNGWCTFSYPVAES